MPDKFYKPVRAISFLIVIGYSTTTYKTVLLLKNIYTYIYPLHDETILQKQVQLKK